MFENVASGKIGHTVKKPTSRRRYCLLAFMILKIDNKDSAEISPPLLLISAKRAVWQPLLHIMATSGYKRTAEGNPKISRLTSIMSPYMPMFETFRNELDEHHDRRERIIKASRDITALSKKM